MAIADTITSMQTHTSNAYTMIGYGTDLTGINKNLENLYSSIFNAFLEALRTPDTLFTNLPKKSSSGANITLNDTANAPMRIELGSTALEQTQTTQSANLLDEEYLKTATYNTATYKNTLTNIKGNRLLYVKAQLKTGKTAISGLYVRLSSTPNPTASGSIYGIFISNGNAVINSTPDFTGKDDLYFTYYPTDANINDIFDRYNFWVSTTDTSYVPFVPNSPSPDYPSDIHTISGSNTIKVMGKNVLDTSNKKTQGLNIYGIPNTLKPNTKYTYSIQGTTNYTYGLFTTSDINSTNTITTLATYTGAGNSRTFTTPADMSNQLGLILGGGQAGASSENIDNILPQIEIGEVQTDFEPYISQEQEVNLGTKNLGNSYGLKSQTSNGITFTPVYDFNGLLQYVNVNGTSTAQTDFRFETNESFPTGTYTISKSANNGDVWLMLVDSGGSVVVRDDDQPRTITTTSDKTAKLWIRVMSGKTINNLRIYPMIEEGSVVHPYTPFGYEPINYCKIGNYEDKFIRNSGKNLFDKDSASQGRLYENGTLAVMSGYFTSQFIKVEPNTQYTKNSPTADAFHRFAFYSSNTEASFISQSTDNTITTPSNCQYLRFCGIDTEVNTTMLEKGSVANFEPYGSNEWYIKKNIGKVVLDGSESNWESSGSNIYRIGSVFPSNVLLRTAPPFALCTHYKYAFYSSDITINIQDGEFSWNGSKYLVIRDTNQATLGDFKTWLGTNKPIIYYPLATPTYTQITGTLAEQLENVYQKMLSQAGQTNISQVNNDLSFNLSVQAIEEL